eukprot:355038_1
MENSGQKESVHYYVYKMQQHFEMQSKYDMLRLAQNIECHKMLSKFGDNDPFPEVVILSLVLIKINRKGNEQNRVLLITDKALYNLKPDKFKTYQRRIDLTKICAISTSTTSQQFAINVPE